MTCSDHVFLLYLKEIQTLSLPCGRVYPSLTEFTERFKNALLSLKEKPEIFLFFNQNNLCLSSLSFKKNDWREPCRQRTWWAWLTVFSRWAGRKRLKPIPQKRDNESEIPKTLSLFMPQISDKEDYFFRFSSRTNAVSFTNLIGLLHGLSRFILEYHKRSCVEHRKFLEGGWIFIWIKENILESRRREFIKHVKNSSLFHNLSSKTLIYT